MKIAIPYEYGQVFHTLAARHNSKSTMQKTA